MIDLDIHGNTKPLEASVQAAINRIRRQPIKITVDDKGATQPLGNMKRGADEFSKSMEAANARIIAFGASMAIINGVSDAFKGMVKNMVEVEKALADINVVMGLSARNLDKFSDSLFKVAKETGAAFNIAAQAATEYARQGLAVEESLKRTKDALILTRLTGMDSANAVKSLTAAMNTYGSQIKDTTQLVSKFAAVDVQFAVSAEDFADAIARTGAAAKGAGVDINELIGFVTAAQQQTARGGKVIGNSLKTIFTRVGRTDTLNQLEGLGIAVRDLEGKTLGAKRILTDLANTFDKLSESQKAQIAQTVGGVFQINVLKAVLGDAARQNGILSTATQIAAGATDEAITKNEQLRLTMSAMATETGLAIKQLSAQIGEIMLAPGMEKILNTVKSFAESASGILGDGESTGNKFATGFLKGLGNIITGPGLVVLTTVFVKLFAQAFKFTKDSLNSLVGITTQAQKQKAIQASLVTLFGQNAALNKEMLRTDISRTEKEKVILGLIQSQVAQAKILNDVSKQAASTLYKQGYGAGLSPRKASGHIPNFSERQQAAQGGYAAGNIRAMDMPGQGSVIYNSAEQVKNFAGFKQPAIMPPQSSKAGKNYQKAFGQVHGFDPYAASGFVPNFSKKDSGNQPLFAAGRSKTSNPVLDLKSLLGPVVNTLGVIHGVGPEGIIPETYTQSITGKKGLSSGAQEALVKAIQAKGHKNFTNADLKGKSIQVTLPTKAIAPVTDKDVQDINRGLGATVAQNKLGEYIKDGLQKFSHTIHERIFAGKTSGQRPNFTADKIMEHVGGGAIGDMYEASLRTALGDKIEDNKHASFDFRGQDAKYLAAFMGDDSLRALEMKYTRAAGKDGEIPKKVINYGLLGKASGFIPNFAAQDPLSDAISRERQAGVPASQIRVDSHPALVNKSNPIGLGVTNTKDEPNGLRDVFGAKGFVPNYAMPGMVKDLFSGLKGDRSYEAYQEELSEARAEQDKQNKQVRKLTREHQRYEAASKSSTLEESRKRLATQKATQAEQKLTLAKQARANTEKKASTASRGKFGAGIRGNLGMTAILGAPMAAAYLQQGGPGQNGASGNMYAAGGALQGAASTGYMASMIAPFFGPAAPLVIAAGALYGAFDGWTSAQKENTAAIKKQNAERVATQAQSYGQGLQSIIQGEELGSKISKMPSIEKNAQILGLKPEDTTGDALIKSFDVLATRANKAPHMDDVSHLPGIEKYQQFFRAGNEYFAPEDRDAALKKSTGDAYNRGNKYARATMDKRIKAVKMSKEYDEFAKSGIGASKEQGQAAKETRDSLIDYFLENEKGNVFDFDFGSTSSHTKSRVVNDLTKEEYAKVLKGETINKKIDNVNHQLKASDEQIAGKVNPALKKLKDDYEKQQAESYQGLIIQLDKEKANRTVRQQTFNAEMKIKQSALSRSNLYLVETELQKKFLSETEIATKKYLHALGEAEDSLKSGKISSEQKTRGAFTALAGGNSDLRAGIASNLGIEGEKMGENATIADITEALSSVPIDKLIEAVKKYQESLGDDTAAKDQKAAVKAVTEEYVEVNRQLKEDNGLKVKGIELENQRNQILADRNRIIRENAEALKAFNEEAEHKKSIRGFQEQQADAAILASGVHVTKEDQARMGIARAQGQISGVRDDYQSQRMSILNELGIDQELQREYKGVQDLNVGEIYAQQKEKSLSSLNQEMSENRSEYKKINEKGSLRSEDDITRQEALNAKFKEQEEVKQKLLEKHEKENKLIDDQQGKLDKLVEKEEEHVKAIEDGAQARLKHLQNMQGPGAMGRGFKKGIENMNEQVKYMDYELGQRIPENLANGLADAMGSAIDGTKKLDDALMDVAINFLQMIQQAFLQKAAYQIVGGIGGMFNNGGGVRNYSKGGSVPARVSDGEYVMNRQAVNKYGGSFMHNLNNGGVPKYHGGGSVADFFGKSNSPSVGDFFKNQAEVKPRSVADFFSSPAQAKSSANNSAAIRRAVNGNMEDLLQRKDFSSKISSSSNAGMMAMSPGSDVSAALSPQSKSGGGFFGNLVSGIGSFTSGIFDMLLAPIKSVGSFFGMPGFASGGPVEKGSAIDQNFGGARGIDSGKLYQRKAMSGYFYSQANNPGVAADKDNMIGVLREEERARQEAEAARQRKKAKKRSLWKAALGAVVSMGVSAIAGSMFPSSGGGGLSGPSASGPVAGYAADVGKLGFDPYASSATSNFFSSSPQTYDFSQPLSGQFSRGGMARRYSFGGSAALTPMLNPTLADVLEKEEVEKRNAGGWISGKSGIDQIPAMLSDGEYVIKASSARRLGRPMLDQINAGKYNEGGSVGDDLDLISDSSESGGGSSNVNNINITINVEKGQAQEDSRDQKSEGDPSKASENEKNGAELAERVRHQVVSVIIDEQRPGGLLSNSK